MTWTDLLSPSLPYYLNAWGNFRGPRKVPSVSAFPDFMKTVATDFVAIVDVSGKRECTFLLVGRGMTTLYPDCHNVTRFADLKPVTLRLTISRPIFEVITTRQPATRRSTYRVSDNETLYEQLYLPFVDKNFEVRRIIIIADGHNLTGSTE